MGPTDAMPSEVAGACVSPLPFFFLISHHHHHLALRIRYLGSQLFIYSSSSSSSVWNGLHLGGLL
jgi:hypothetical protein